MPGPGYPSVPPAGRAPAGRPARAWLRPVRVVGVLAVLGVAAALVAVNRTDGYPHAQVSLSGGTAWLASPAQGLVTLIDGPSEQVVGNVRMPGGAPGDQLSVSQAGASAFVVDNTQGTVARVDGATYEVSEPVRFGSGGQLDVFAGPPGRGGPAGSTATTAYVVDGVRRLASVIDPGTLRVRSRLSLAASPGPGQSVLDGASRLWVVDGAARGASSSRLSGFDGSATPVRSDVGDAGSQLVVVQGRAVLVDAAHRRAGWIEADGRVRSWTCLEIGPADRVQVLGSATSARVFAAMSATGTLVTSDLGRDECASSVPVGAPGDDFGQLVESGGYVLVPDRTTGRTAVVDAAAGTVAADLTVLPGGGKLELLAKDGLVFYNDLAGDRAGVVRFDGGRWAVGTSTRKFAAGATGNDLLAPGGNGADTQGVGANPDPASRNPGGQNPGQSQNPPGPGTQNPGTQNVPGAPPPDLGSRYQQLPDAGTPPPDSGAVPPVPPDPTPPSQPVQPPPSSSPPSSPPPPVTQLALTVSVQGPGLATAQNPAPTGLAAGARCAADTRCVWRYPAGTAVTLRLPATTGTGATLRGVTGCQAAPTGAGSTDCTLTLTAATTVTATYDPPTPTPKLTVTTPAGGTVTGGGISCPGTCSATLTAPITLAATPALGYTFAGWGGACAGTGTCTVPTGSAATVSAAFADQAAPEDCIGYNPAQLAIRNLGATGFQLTDGNSALNILDTMSDAQNAMSVARGYTQQCFVGRGTRFIMQYWKGGSGTPGAVSTPDCIGYSRTALTVVQTGDATGTYWSLRDPNTLLEASTTQAGAIRELRVAQQHTQQCFLGRGNRRSNREDYIFEYWR